MKKHFGLGIMMTTAVDHLTNGQRTENLGAMTFPTAAAILRANRNE